MKILKIDHLGIAVNSIEEGKSFSHNDIDQFAPGAEGLECEYGMYWWNENVTAELPDLE